MELDYLTRGELWRLYYTWLDAVCSDDFKDEDLKTIDLIEQELTDRYGVTFAPF